MSKKNNELPGIFNKVVKNIDTYNQPDLQSRRRTFALSNSYANKINEIEKLAEKN